jgi:hypothetical protein
MTVRSHAGAACWYGVRTVKGPATARAADLAIAVVATACGAWCGTGARKGDTGLAPVSGDGWRRVVVGVRLRARCPRRGSPRSGRGCGRARSTSHRTGPGGRSGRLGCRSGRLGCRSGRLGCRSCGRSRPDSGGGSCRWRTDDRIARLDTRHETAVGGVVWTLKAQARLARVSVVLPDVQTGTAH